MTTLATRPAPYPGPAGVVSLLLLIVAAVFLPRVLDGMGFATADDWVSWWPVLIPVAGILIVGMLTLRTLLVAMRERRYAQERPGEPWRWRARWREDGIRGNAGSHAVELAIWAGLALAMAVVVDLLVVRELAKPEPGQGMGPVLAAGLVTLVAAFLLVKLVQALRTWFAWRQCRLHLERLPVRLGETWRGRLEVPAAWAGKAGITLKFGVYRSVHTRNNRSLSLQGAPLWETEPVAITHAPGADSVPLEFRAPADRPVSDWSRRHENTHWQVTVMVRDKPGLQFELPVFR